jgi:hypothetical protein
MFKKVLLFGFLWIVQFAVSANGKQTQIPVDSLQNVRALTDSIDTTAVLVVDTITPKMLKPLDSAAIVFIADSLGKGLGYPMLDFDKLNEAYRLNSINKNTLKEGIALLKGETWVLGFVVFLLLLFAILKQNFSKQLAAIVQSFFSNRALSNLNKEDNLFTSWPFLLLFIQFGFTIGMFFYLMAKNQGQSFAANGFQSYLTISVIIIAMYVFKILLLRLLGFVFNIQKPVNEYVSILYLSYFNSSLLFMPLVVAFALSPLTNSHIYMVISCFLVAMIFVFQFIRAGFNILSHYRFSKVYLFLYFCTLEICPILILIKTIGF